jgi:hypothetical protein
MTKCPNCKSLNIKEYDTILYECNTCKCIFPPLVNCPIEDIYEDLITSEIESLLKSNIMDENIKHTFDILLVRKKFTEGTIALAVGMGVTAVMMKMFNDTFDQIIKKPKVKKK